MKSKTNFVKKFISIFLCFAIILPVFSGLVGSNDDAEASASLPYVEQRKTSGTTYNILEIVPGVTQGSIGYYIAGSEPWLALAGKQSSSSARKTFVETTLPTYLNKSRADQDIPQNNYAIELCTPSRVAVSNDSYPLNNVGNYQEVYPWQYLSAPTTTYSGYSGLALDHVETALNVPGTFSTQLNGGYVDNNNTYTFNPSGGSNYIQLIEGFSKTQAPNSYYYDVTFKIITYIPSDPASKPADWTLVYRAAEAGETPDLTENIGGVDIGLCIVGIVGTPEFPGLDSANTYYSASWGAPSATYNSATASYRAISDSFIRKDGAGYFSTTTNNYKYVGTGGTYSFTPSSTGAVNNIAYSTVYFTGGFTNNNWFLKNVFNWETGENKPTIKVNTVTPDKVTPSVVNNADLIVVNCGLNIAGNTYDGIYRTDFSNSTLVMSGSAQAELLAKCAATTQTSKIPIIFDYNLKDSSQTLINNFVDTLITNAGMSSKTYDTGDGGVTHITYVSGNQYCINYAQYAKTESEGGETHTSFYFGLALACKGFNDPTLTYGDTTDSQNPFFEVYEDIYYENFLREIRNEKARTSTPPGATVSLLNTDMITMATAIRDIMNSLKKRTSADKKIVNVLDIEPRGGNLLPEQKSKLAEWLGLNLSDPTNQLNVTTMSTAEFVGKTEDLRNKYDLIFLGDSTIGFETDSNGKTSYIDNTNMQNLIYSNIGDTVVSGGGTFVSGFGLSGLLQRDYSNSTKLNNNNTARTFRYSGNDLTIAAAKKLKSFADSGYPIIGANNLIINTLQNSGDAVTGYARTNDSTGVNEYFSRCKYTPTSSTDANLLLKVSISRSIIDWEWWLFIPIPHFYFGRIKTADCTLYSKKSGTSVWTQVADSTKSISNGSTVNYDLSKYNNGDQFYCKINVLTASTFWGQIFGNCSDSPEGQTATYTLYKGANPTYVDANSNMYSLLNSICSKANVKRWDAIKDSPLNINLLKKFVILPKPEIEFSTSPNEYPNVYQNNSGVITDLTPTDGANRLKYVLTIRNSADPLPQSTHYTCNLYIDNNGNGSFSDDEKITDVGIREGNSLAPGARVTNGQLVADKQYYVYYDLSSSKLGLIPWKLEIEDSVYGAYVSETNFTHVTPATDNVPQIKILQIRPTSDSDCNIDLSSNTKITAFLNAVSNDFTVSVSTLKVDDANAMTAAALTTLFDNVDLLVLGFGDSYGNLDLETTQAVQTYIVGNNPVLMSHDVTSYFFLPNYNFKVNGNSVYGGSGSNAPSGYFVNMLLRGAIGMDRYGVTDENFGYTTYTPSIVTGRTPAIAGTVANSYSGANLPSIKTYGYDIAYQPKFYNTYTTPATGTTVGETQGLTNGVLARFLVSGKMPFSGAKFSSADQTNKAGFTDTVTQVNKGQITSYPYDVNTASFGGTIGMGNTLQVAETHLQYFQLNMNKSDMTVWYCLEDGTSSTYPKSNIYPQNDVVNDYYIYTCGNVTYTGMGHSNGALTDNEAKLLVNTLIAAYRITEVPPTVSFSNENGTQMGIDSFFIPSDGEILTPAATTGITEESRRIYFTINDSNVIKNKTITAVFKFGEPPLTLQIYDADTNQPVISGASLSSTFTYYVKLDDVLSALRSNGLSIGSNGLNFTAEVTTTLPSGNIQTGRATLSLRMLSLLELY